MADDVKELLIRVNATTELLRSNLTAAERAVADFERDTQKRLTNVDRNFDKLGAGIARVKSTLGGLSLGGLAGAFAGGAIVAAAKGALDYASSLGEVSQQLGVTTKDLQEYRFIATQVGISQDQMDAGLGKLTRSIGQAISGNRAIADTFRGLGISLIDTSGKTRSTGAVMDDLVAKLSAIPDAAKRAEIETTLFGKAGQKLDTLLAGGTGQVDNLRDAAQKLGVVLSDEQIQKADDTADKLAKMKTVLEANISKAVADNADAILALGDALVAIVNNVGAATRGLKEFFSQAARDERILSDPLLKGSPVADAARKRSNPTGYAIAKRDEALAQRDRVQELIRKKADPAAIDDAVQRLRIKTAELKRIEADLRRDNAASRSSRQTGAGEAGIVAGDRPQPPAGPFDAETGIGGGTGGGASRGRGRSSALGALKADAQSVIPDLDKIRGSLEDIKISTDFNGEEQLREIVERIDRRKDYEFEANQQAADDFKRKMESQIDFLSRMFEDGFRGGTDAIWGNFKQIGLQVVAQILARLAAAQIGGGGGGGGFGSIVSASIGAVLGFANGGNPPVGKASLVGERGPELIVPRSPMTVIPNYALGGGGGTSISYTINAPGATAETVSMIRRELANAAPAMIEAATRNTTRSLSRGRL